MERPDEVLTNSSSPLPKIQHEAMQSVMTSKQPDRRITEKFVVQSPLGLETLQSCHYIVLYYNKASEHDSGWIAAGRFKESLGRALSEAPLFCGRLKAEEECFQLVANDSGVRLIEARLPVSLQEFLQLRKQGDHHVEAQLVHWENIDEKNPQFCPLFYLQVTNFQCGSYSVGISCNIVLADPLELTNFIKKWTKIHTGMFSEGDSASVPVFYSPNLKTTNSHKPFYGSTLQDHHGQTLILNVASEKAISEDATELRALIMQCIEHTEKKFGVKMDPNFALFMKLLASETNVELCSKHEPSHMSVKSGMKISSSSWEDLKIKEIEFVQGNQALDASYWIGLRRGDEGLVVVDASSDKAASGAMNIFVTIPVEKKI